MGFEWCPIHLDYCQVANMSISRDFNLKAYPKLTFDFFMSMICIGMNLEIVFEHKNSKKSFIFTTFELQS